ncbi:glycosyltransferase [Paenibacillus campinasensis]|uniref:Glycosyltransferase n=1 Tax=Paenibacillus campinasensis TaxID=66347 RepID=A0ABW9SVY6_9BACL|nr:glycosyltransferase family 4 protein [Paenibacillus campinasensis]MUG65139.1 glycosyltransferase [Paenibacillus campinasensis]
MKIAFYNHTSTISGAEISLLLTAKHMTEASPVLFAPEGELLAKARSYGIEVCPLPSFRARMTRNPVMLAVYAAGTWWAGWKLARTIRRSGVDLIHANSIRAGIMASLFRWYHRLPVVWHIRDMPPQGVIGRVVGRMAGTAQALIGISEPVIQGISHAAPVDRVHLVHNGVELRAVDPSRRREIGNRIREQLQTPPDAEVLAIIGQIAPWKRQEDALEALSRLVREGRNAVLWIVGEAKFRQENERYLAKLKAKTRALGLVERVVFTGFREDILEICCEADLLLLCSDNEPFGRVIIEAMSQGTPVVASRGGGVPEIIEHNESGLMYDSGSIHELVHCIRRVLDDETLWLKLSQNGQERAEAMFSITETSRKVERIYHQLLHSSSAPAMDRQQAKEMM